MVAFPHGMQSGKQSRLKSSLAYEEDKKQKEVLNALAIVGGFLIIGIGGFIVINREPKIGEVVFRFFAPEQYAALKKIEKEAAKKIKKSALDLQRTAKRAANRLQQCQKNEEQNKKDYEQSMRELEEIRRKGRENFEKAMAKLDEVHNKKMAALEKEKEEKEKELAPQ